MWLLSSVRLVLRRLGSSRGLLSQFFFVALKEATVASLLKCNCRFACHVGNRRSAATVTPSDATALRRLWPGRSFYGLADVGLRACPRPAVFSYGPLRVERHPWNSFCFFNRCNLLTCCEFNPSRVAGALPWVVCFAPQQSWVRSRVA